MSDMMESRIYKFWHLGAYKYPFYKSQLLILLLSYIQNSSLILDVGCGPNGGYLTKIPINIQLVGLDVSRANIKNSIKESKKNKKNMSSFIVGDIEKMPFREDIFDVIICQDVLEHIKDKDTAIGEMAFSLKGKGKILISTTNAFSPAMFIDDRLPKKVSENLIRILGGPQFYERACRLNPWNFNRILINHGIIMRKMLLIGYPPIGEPWIYQYFKKKVPMIFHIWIFFNRLTDIHFLENFKEIILVGAEKRTDRSHENKLH